MSCLGINVAPLTIRSGLGSESDFEGRPCRCLPSPAGTSSLADVTEHCSTNLEMLQDTMIHSKILRVSLERGEAWEGRGLGDPHLVLGKISTRHT